MSDVLLVTGGLGFIGNEVVRQALRQNTQVVIFDNRSRVADDIEDISSALLIEGDVTDRDAVFRTLSEVRPTRIIHLAAMHYIPECNQEPGYTVAVNAGGTANLLDAALSIGAPHVVIASSGAVYADVPDGRVHENSTVEPVDIYGYSKLFAEQLCALYARRGGRATAGRLFNTYGPRETNPHIIPEVLRQLHLGDTLTLGNISARRDFVYVNDVAEAFLRLSQSVPEPKTVRTVNIASGSDYSMQDIIQTIARLLGREVKIEFDPSRLRPVDKQVQVADVGRLGQTLGWVPATNLEDGISNLLAFDRLLPVANTQGPSRA